MIIGIDGNEANVKEKVGVSVYALNLLNYFNKRAKNQLRFTVFLRSEPLTDLPKENQYYRYHVIKGSFFWSQFFLPLNLFLKKNVDVFFSPAHYVPRYCPVPLVVTIHDLSYFYFPDEFRRKDLYQLINWTRYSVKNAKKIIAVSKTTKKDLVKYYEAPEDKIEVVYNGYEKINQKPKVKSQNYNSKLKISNSYILYVGTLQPRKNIATLIEAFEKFHKQHPEFKLVIAGKKGWMFEKIFSTVKELKLEKYVKFVGFIPDNLLISLYKNAFCFVLPSLYEGFGIPILEAMSFGCPVISSFASSLPEVGGDACLYFDPKNSLELTEKLNELISNDAARLDLIKKGKDRVKLFSWNKSAEQTLEIIKSVIK